MPHTPNLTLVATDVAGCPGWACAFKPRMYIVFIIGTERATSRKSRNSMSSRLAVTIDKVLCLCNSFMAAISRPGS